MLAEPVRTQWLTLTNVILGGAATLMLLAILGAMLGDILARIRERHRDA